MNIAVNPTKQTNPVRSMVRGIYDLQHLRIQAGNRIAANFRSKLGQTPDGMSEEDLEKEQKSVLDDLRKSYVRITDGIVENHTQDNQDDDEKEIVTSNLPTRKKFIGDNLISTYTELILVHQYIELLASEQKHFKQLNNVLEDFPIYTEYLKGVPGVGPAISAIIISEIDIHAVVYPSQIWAYAGLDVVTLGKYVNDKGQEKIVPAHLIETHFKSNTSDYLAEGKYPITYFSEGRSRKEHSLVDRTYINKDGEEATKRSITFNPFLKTKLIGVLGSSFLKVNRILVNGKRTGSAKRVALAKEEGYQGDVKNQDAVDSYLVARGMTVVNDSCVFNREYYDYKRRLENNPAHDGKSAGHKHNMAVRYIVKLFLAELYNEWRRLEGLPVAMTYQEAKLGLVHGRLSPGKLKAA